MKPCPRCRSDAQWPGWAFAAIDVATSGKERRAGMLDPGGKRAGTLRTAAAQPFGHVTVVVPVRLRLEMPLVRIRPTTPNLARFGPTTPKRARRPSDASVDPTEARNVLVLSQPDGVDGGTAQAAPERPPPLATAGPAEDITAGLPPRRPTQPEAIVVFGGRSHDSPPLALASPQSDRRMPASTALRCLAAIFFRRRRLSWGRAVLRCMRPGWNVSEPRRSSPGRGRRRSGHRRPCR